DSKLRSGRPKKLTPIQVRYIRRLIKRDPYIGWVALRNGSTTSVSISTIRRSLSKYFNRK
ncbi:hypothetical protein BT67DRAFT_386169, partial [Trichocladium antarcticum]